MAQTNVFALKNTGLEPFLHAEVGTESNGSELTVLSLLARRGLDPWAEAARWVDLPKAASIDSLAQSIAQASLGQAALAGARATAARLIEMLPRKTDVGLAAAYVAPAAGVLPKWLPVALCGCALLFGLCLNMFATTRTGTVTASPPVEQTLIHNP